MRSSWWADALEPAVVGLTEGIWVAVLYLLVEIVARTPTTIATPVFVVVAALAAFGGDHLGRLGGARWQIVTVAALVVGVIGTITGPGVLTSLLAGDPGDAIGANPGGWLLGLAAFRGMIGAGALDDPDRATGPFVRGVVALTLIWLYAGLLPDASQAAFRASALGPTLIFATVGIGAIGVRRVHAIALPAGIEWWRNRAWLAALALLVVALAVVAFPVASQLTGAIPAILGLAGFPEVAVFVMLVVWLVVPRRRAGRPRSSTLRGTIGLVVLLVVGAFVYRLLHPSNDQGQAAAAATQHGLTTTSYGLFGVVAAVVILIGVGLLAILLARSRRAPAKRLDPGSLMDESGVQIEAPGLAWLRRIRRRLVGERGHRRPASAQAAYLATLELLEPLRDLRRLPHETPQAHARRVRHEGLGSLDLELLAADYELTRWGGRRLPARETRRAIGRWERSRAWITARIEAEEVARQFAAERNDAEPA